jgi:hypothetical protein
VEKNCDFSIIFCGRAHNRLELASTFVTTLLVDEDPDFIPWHLLHKDIAAMVPIISLILN